MYVCSVCIKVIRLSQLAYWHRNRTLSPHELVLILGHVPPGQLPLFATPLKRPQGQHGSFFLTGVCTWNALWVDFKENSDYVWIGCNINRLIMTTWASDKISRRTKLTWKCCRKKIAPRTKSIWNLRRGSQQRRAEPRGNRIVTKPYRFFRWAVYFFPFSERHLCFVRSRSSKLIDFSAHLFTLNGRKQTLRRRTTLLSCIYSLFRHQKLFNKKWRQAHLLRQNAQETVWRPGSVGTHWRSWQSSVVLFNWMKM